MLCHWATKAYDSGDLFSTIMEFESGDDLLSRAVSSQVPSACWGLTSVFGMGTGGSLRLLSPEILCGCQILLDPSNDFQITIHIVIQPLSGLFESFSTPWKPHRELTWNFTTSLQLTLRSSPRPISIIKLHPLPNFHRWPIYLIVSEGSYLLLAVAILFSRGASRLDAFSVYPFRTSLPSRAIGMTTVAPEVRPSRSSRTRDSSHQNSCAHDG